MPHPLLVFMLALALPASTPSVAAQEMVRRTQHSPAVIFQDAQRLDGGQWTPNPATASWDAACQLH
jgi:hypothetical protein